jgi:hypothetical protein
MYVRMNKFYKFSHIKIIALPVKVEEVEFAGVGCALFVNQAVKGSPMSEYCSQPWSGSVSPVLIKHLSLSSGQKKGHSKTKEINSRT